MGRVPAARAADLQTAVGDGYASATEILERVRSPALAAVLDTEVEALRSEVPEEYLRGVAEAFQLSYGRLARSGLEDAVHRFALLPPMAITGVLLDGLIATRELGGLHKRGWIDSAPGAVSDRGRQYRMHRITASYLRAVNPHPEANLATMAEWLRTALAPERGRTAAGLPALLAALFDAAKPDIDPATFADVADLARTIALLDLADASLRGVRYLATAFLDEAGRSAAVVAALGEAYADADADAAQNLPHQLQGAGSQRAAAELVAKLLADTRPSVRYQAIIHAGGLRQHAPLLAGPLLDATIAAEEGFAETAVESYENLLVPRSEGMRAALSHLSRASTSDSTHARTVACTIFGRLLRTFEDGIEAGGYRRAQIEGHLVEKALHDDDAGVRAAAARALGMGQAATGYERLVDALQAGADADGLTALTALDAYLREAELPPPPDVWWGRGPDGPVLQGNLGSPRTLAPERYQPLVALAAGGGAATLVALAAAACLATSSGESALQHAARDLLEAKAFARVVVLSDAVLAENEEYMNAYWWRGQAHEATGDSTAAIGDYHRVVELAPFFVTALQRSAYLLDLAGNAAAAIDDYHRVVDCQPELVSALLRSAVLLEAGGDAQGAIHDLTRLIDSAYAGNDRATALAERAELLYQERREAEALRDFDALVDPSGMPLYRQAIYAHCLLYAARFQEALTVADAVIEREPTVARYWLLRADAHANGGGWDAALDDIAQAEVLAPGDPLCTQVRTNIESARAAQEPAD